MSTDQKLSEGLQLRRTQLLGVALAVEVEVAQGPVYVGVLGAQAVVPDPSLIQMP